MQDRERSSNKLAQNLRNVIDSINLKLAQLDNGGFVIEYNLANVVKLNKSDVRIGRTYTDRLDGNKTKLCDTKDIMATTFCFQEAVKQLEQKNDVILRWIFFISFDSGFSNV